MRRNWQPVAAGLLGALALAAAARAESAATALDAGLAAFRSAGAAWSAAGFQDAADHFARACRAAPASFPAHYWLAAARFHALLCRPEADPDSAGAAGDRRATAEALERALELRPADAECHAMLGTLIGMQIAAAPATALWRGPRAARHRRAALRGDPPSPRALLLVAIGLLKAPFPWGDPAEAAALLQRARGLFEAERIRPRDGPDPAWGYDHCLAFLGNAHLRLGQQEQAAACYREALAVNPRHRIAEKGLAACKEHSHNTSP